MRSFSSINYYIFKSRQIESSTLRNVMFDILDIKTNFISFYFLEHGTYFVFMLMGPEQHISLSQAICIDVCNQVDLTNMLTSKPRKSPWTTPDHNKLITLFIYLHGNHGKRIISCIYHGNQHSKWHGMSIN